MIKLAFDDKAFLKDMKNIVEYSVGYLDGIHAGKKEFLNNLGVNSLEMLKQYIDSNARVNPQMLHHVYEWYQVGSPNARLFDLEYTVSNVGLSFKSTFRQSETIQSGSNVPFFNKAKIMEEGMPVTISPKRAKALAFEIDGQEVFSKSPVTVSNPGGDGVEGAYESVFDSFFSKYFKQSFMTSSGIKDYLEKPTLYKKNLSQGKKSGRSAGVSTGYRWIANAGVIR